MEITQQLRALAERLNKGEGYSTDVDALRYAADLLEDYQATRAERSNARLDVFFQAALSGFCANPAMSEQAYQTLVKAAKSVAKWCVAEGVD